ncbi:hypothetical protein ACHQM5_018851 [Ranunculus cassubicifolius]
MFIGLFLLALASKTSANTVSLRTQEHQAPEKFTPNEAIACSYEIWLRQENFCYWAIDPNTKIAHVFGKIAAKRYGKHMTLLKGLQGKGEIYKTLLREAITALLNAYNNPFVFPYFSDEVISQTSMALTLAPKEAVQLALAFKRANVGAGNFNCDFVPCK